MFIAAGSYHVFDLEQVVPSSSLTSLTRRILNLHSWLVMVKTELDIMPGAVSTICIILLPSAYGKAG